MGTTEYLERPGRNQTRLNKGNMILWKDDSSAMEGKQDNWNRMIPVQGNFMSISNPEKLFCLIHTVYVPCILCVPGGCKFRLLKEVA